MCVCTVTELKEEKKKKEGGKQSHENQILANSNSALVFLLSFETYRTRTRNDFHFFSKLWTRCLFHLWFENETVELIFVVSILICPSICRFHDSRNVKELMRGIFPAAIAATTPLHNSKDDESFLLENIEWRNASRDVIRYLSRRVRYNYFYGNRLWSIISARMLAGNIHLSSPTFIPCLFDVRTRSTN